MIARPKMSQNEWKTTEIRASKVGNFSPFSCPGAFGALVSCMVLSTGFGVELNDLQPYNPFAWHARVNHLRWYVQGVVLRVRRGPHFHGGGVDAAAVEVRAAADAEHDALDVPAQVVDAGVPGEGVVGLQVVELDAEARAQDHARHQRAERAWAGKG